MKIIKFFKKPSKIILWLMDRNIFFFLNDKIYLKLKFRLKMSKKLNLNNPQTFNEKLQWLKINDRKDIYTIMVDKYEVKNYVSKKIGEEYLIPTIGIYNSFEEINFEKLPNQFVIKCTHDSGGLVICRDKTNLDVKKAKKKINKYLKRKYFYIHREWPYKNVKPRIIIEKYMEDEKDNELRDYKLFCFNGTYKMMFIATNRQGEGDTYFDFFDRDFNHLPFTNGHPNAPKLPHKPHNYKKMIELAEKLSANIPQVRVDFYEVNGKIYFGEMTFFHWSGLVPFEPEKWDIKLGDWIKLPKK